MTTVRDVYSYINEIAPLRLAEKWDNCGLIVGDMDRQVRNCMVVLDVTQAVIDEACENAVDLIISHHPIIFEAQKQILSQSLVYKLIQNGISVISAHTNLDIAQGGINDVLAERLGLKKTKVLEVTDCTYDYKIITFAPKEYEQKVKDAMSLAGAGKLENYSSCAFVSRGEGSFLPMEGSNAFIGQVGEIETVEESRIEMICPWQSLSSVLNAMLKAHPYEQPAFDVFENHAIKREDGIGRVGELEKEQSPEQFASFVKNVLGCERVRFSKGKDTVKKVAICSGAGSSVFKHAVSMEADAFVSGDIKHDVMVDAKKFGITVIDAGHFETENIIIEVLEEHLSQKFNNFTIIKSKQNSCPYEFI
ncbi:MAG: hypothetical protein K0R90_202 [Oscillospiraceae bacterium]|nr:hypothetical protein [Oscillospiraceae bacterium]